MILNNPTTYSFIMICSLSLTGCSQDEKNSGYVKQETKVEVKKYPFIGHWITQCTPETEDGLFSQFEMAFTEDKIFSESSIYKDKNCEHHISSFTYMANEPYIFVKETKTYEGYNGYLITIPDAVRGDSQSIIAVHEGKLYTGQPTLTTDGLPEMSKTPILHPN